MLMMSFFGVWLWIWYGNLVKIGEVFLYCDLLVVWFYREEECVKMVRVIVLVVILLFYVIVFGFVFVVIEKWSKVGCFFFEFNFVYIYI